MSYYRSRAVAVVANQGPEVFTCRAGMKVVKSLRPGTEYQRT